MPCEPNTSGLKQETAPDVVRKRSVRSKLAALAATSLAALAVACNGGSSSINPPPPPAANERFFVGNFSGNISGFSAASGKLEPIPGSSITFSPSFLTHFAVKPDGTLLAAITVDQQLVARTLQIVNIGTGGTLTLTRLTSRLGNPGGMAISSQGVIAITDVANGTVQLTLVQNNLFFQGASAATGPLPQDVVFSSDGSRLYVGNNAGGTISVFAVSAQGATLQPVQTALLPVAAEFAPTVVRVTLSASGRKFAATTPDGRLFVGNVSPMDGTLSGFTETQLGTNANLEEVVFDPTAQNVYTTDQDNGGIFGFTLSTGGGVTPLPGSPFSTGTLPGGPTGMAFNSAGDRLYAVIQGQVVFTYSRNTSSGQLALTGDVVSSGGFLAGRIVRVPAH